MENDNNAKEIGKLVRNMEEDEFIAAVKNIPSQIMFEELVRRDKKMIEMIQNIRQIVKVGGGDETA